MTQPEVPESTVNELHALYREGAKAEPGLMLDRGILDAARAELRTNGVTKRQSPWWKGWLPVTSAIAVAIAGLSITWRVMDEQERHLREEMRAAQAEDERVGRAVPTQRPVEAQSSLGAPAPAAAAVMAPILVEEAVKKSARALGKLEAKSLGASGVTVADTAAQPSVDAATPEAWLKHIRELRAAGRSAEAAQSLARFRARYPDFVLPDDLLTLK